MRKVVLIILQLVFILTNSYGQNKKIIAYKNCEIINGDTVNCETCDGIKNGYWIKYKVGIRGHPDFVKTQKYVEYKTYINLVSEGEYKDNKKVGEWKYYSKYNVDDSQFIERIVYFNQNELKDSTESEYYSNGELKSESFWNNGEQDSLKVFFRGGIVRFQVSYYKGELNKFKIFYQDGKIKYTGSNIINYKVQNLSYFDPNGKETLPRDNDIVTIAINEDLINYLDRLIK